MNINNIKSVYFVGAGGIGMSAIARYFLKKGLIVGGYDKTPSDLTRQLEKEGMLIHYEEDINQIPQACKNQQECLVIYTPAIPAEHKELCYFQENGFEIQKRAQVLGTLTKTHKGLCVAGTHGKTTTSTMCAHIMHQSHLDCNAFLGGISKNYGTNYILSDSDYVVIEADEFDRSFHWLRPWMSVITSTDPDHLDIYGTKEAYLESFRHYSELIQPGGALIIHRDLEMKEHLQDGVRRYDYSLNEGDFHAENIRIENGEITFDFISPIESVKDINLGQPIPINIENGIAAMAMAQLNGCTAEELKYGMQTYGGVDRRFDFKIKTNKLVFLSDYAHHPKEIYQSARSIRELYKDKHITAIFQPHLYTRTRDFYKDFADALSQLDEVILTEIYPARELPIEGVTSKLIYDNLKPGVKKEMIRKDDVLNFVKNHTFEVLIVLGAVLAVTSFNKPDAKVSHCKEVKIDIEQNIVDGFMTADEIKQALNKEHIYPLKQPLSDISPRKIEETLQKNPFVEKAEAYKTQSGNVCIQVKQRIPVVRVMADNGENYYLDTHGNMMPESRYVTDLIIATGSINSKYAKNTLTRVASHILYDQFWRNQIVQMNILEDGSIEIVPRVGEHIAYLGAPVDIEKKLDRLRKFYIYGLNQVGWNKYNYISVEFNNQIICKKNKRKK